MSSAANTHFHIRWSNALDLDWEAFPNREIAIHMAKRLIRESETYEIEEFDDSCPRCAVFRQENKIPN